MDKTPNEVIADRHAHHAPANDRVGEMHGRVRDAFTNLSVALNEAMPACRELSLAMTKLDEARMWANDAVALHQVEARAIGGPLGG